MNEEKKLKEIISIIQKEDSTTSLFGNNELLSTYIYLADWKSCLETNEPISKIKWSRGKNGPKADVEIGSYIQEENFLNVNKIKESLKSFFESKKDKKVKSIKSKEAELIKELINNIKKNEINRVFLIAKSTYPMMATSNTESLNLKKMSRRYKHKYLKNKDAKLAIKDET